MLLACKTVVAALNAALYTCRQVCMYISVGLFLSHSTNDYLHLSPTLYSLTDFSSHLPGLPTKPVFLARRRKEVVEVKTVPRLKEDTDGPRTHCDSMTHSPRCFKDYRALTSCHKVVSLPTSFVCLFLR